MTETRKIYFASDFHLGLPAGSPPVEREKKVVSWLNSIARDAKEIYLLGDVFDFWWEYKLVVPRGFTRFLETVSSITDSGMPVHFLPGIMTCGPEIIYPLNVVSLFILHPSQHNLTVRKFTLLFGEGLGTKNTGYSNTPFNLQKQTVAGDVFSPPSFNWGWYRTQMVFELLASVKGLAP